MISERVQGKESSNSSISNLKPIRADKFVDLVDSLLMTWLTHYSCFVSGSREDVTWLTHYSCLYLAQRKI